MAKVAVMFAPGFEEGEALFTVDVIRRAAMECDIVGLFGSEVTGAHDITVKADTVFDGTLEGYDMVVLPGGMGGAIAMRDHDGLCEAVRKLDEQGKFVTAICAAPIALHRYGLLEGHTFTSYPSVAEQITAGTRVDEIVALDGNVITSQGPGTTLAFAYALVDALGGDSAPMREAMRYNRLFE